MHHRTQKHSIDGLITLVLFGVFAACILSVLLTGAEVYRKLTQRDQAAFNRRTGIQYMATKVRQSANASQVRVDGFEDYEDIDCFYYTEQIDGYDYVTQVYCYDGWLMELFTMEGSGAWPEDGEKVLEAQAMDLDLDGDLLTVSITDVDGGISTLTMSLRGEVADS